jgi:hypothetical protein
MSLLNMAILLFPGIYFFRLLLSCLQSPTNSEFPRIPLDPNKISIREIIGMIAKAPGRIHAKKASAQTLTRRCGRGEEKGTELQLFFIFIYLAVVLFRCRLMTIDSCLAAWGVGGRILATGASFIDVIA